MSDNVILETKGLKKYYEDSAGLLDSLLGKKNRIKAVDNVDLRIEQGEVYGLVGESGSGKSTLGETVIHLEEPTDGEIYFDGENILEFDRRELHEFRQKAQIIFQDPYGSLNPKKTVLQSVSEPLKNYDYETADAEDRVRELLFEVGLRPPEEFLQTYPAQLSGGQLQRVNIARALVLEPDLLIADEPMSMLDVSIQAGILKILEDLQNKLDFTILFISHNLALTRLVADKIGVMYSGKIVEEGDVEEIMKRPKHPYTQALMRSLPDLSTERERVLLTSSADDTDQRQVSGCNFHPLCPEKMDICENAEPGLAEAEGRNVRCYLYHDENEQEAEKAPMLRN